ncbi:hypothetical protein ACC862_24140 [Rhizobium ruizarguesonis]
MEAIITRNMTVANAKGEAEAFEASDKPITIDADTYRRLNRASAAVVYVPEGAAVPTIADADGIEGGTAETVEDLMELNKPDLIAKAETETADFEPNWTKQKIADAIIAKRATA